ncbi:phosphoglycerate mutase [Caenimonas koreensis DSM 17982]|uniref:Phosphoglycerate mutase n=1 Tax=Caenimonas koreensis DSM 17982 TaxID=1121255 RepID=A0A844B6G4_9BURK|nr:phosphoglycerate mutase [Caenimonas koreensis]MRD46141.1 phosphoglycerate mutase [Caenimonas koreensis DSM 17982]
MLIPFASALAEGCRAALRELALPNLEKLLARLQPGEIAAGEPESLSMPHERLLARVAGIDAADGCLPLAALGEALAGHETGRAAFAWITPCHWRVARDHIAMVNPDEMNLSQAESMAVLDAVRPYFEEDGMHITYQSPLRWLARGDIFAGLATASLDRVAGKTIDTWMPRAANAAPLRRLQQEAQMLLYTHAVSDARQASGLAPVNSFWVSGAGALPASFDASAVARWNVDERLRTSALNEDWPAWAAAWGDIDSTACAQLLAALDAGREVTLALCGERGAQTWRPRERGGYLNNLGARMARLVGRKQVSATLEAL